MYALKRGTISHIHYTTAAADISHMFRLIDFLPSGNQGIKGTLFYTFFLRQSLFFPSEI